MGDHQGWPRPAKMTFPSGDVPRSITRLPSVPGNCIRSVAKTEMLQFVTVLTLESDVI